MSNLRVVVVSQPGEDEAERFSIDGLAVQGISPEVLRITTSMEPSYLTREFLDCRDLLLVGAGSVPDMNSVDGAVCVGLSSTILRTAGSDVATVLVESLKNENLLHPGIVRAKDHAGFLRVSGDALRAIRGFSSAVTLSEMFWDVAMRARALGIGVKEGLAYRRADKANTLPSRTLDLTEPSEHGLFADLDSVFGGAPLVSVIISTFNRSDFLGECIDSVLAQSFRDFELIVVDDGSEDGTADLLNTYSDPRVRTFRRQNAGISAARNFGLSQARGRYVAVMDDDDLMLPHRLRDSLSALRPGDHGIFGVSVHFDNSTGAMHPLVHRNFRMDTAIRHGQNPTHPTWLILRSVMESFPYDESFVSGVDNNVAMRMVRSGIRLRHARVPLLMRRVHDGQITRSAGEAQRSNARMSRLLLEFIDSDRAGHRAPTEPEWPVPPAETDLDALRVWLPDHLTNREVVLESNNVSEATFEKLGQYGDVIQSSSAAGPSGTTHRALLRHVTWEGLRKLNREGWLIVEAFEPGRGGFASKESAAIQQVTSGRAVIEFVTPKGEGAEFLMGLGQASLEHEVWSDDELDRCVVAVAAEELSLVARSLMGAPQSKSVRELTVHAPGNVDINVSLAEGATQNAD